MFDATTTLRNKGRIRRLILELIPTKDDSGGGDDIPYNGDIVYDIGHEEDGEFIADESHTLHFGDNGVDLLIGAIQGTTTMGGALQAVESLLLSRVENIS
jgi:hypothetical protein